MASACVNINSIGISSDTFLDLPPPTFPSFGWLSPPHSLTNNDSSNNLNLPHSPEIPPDPDAFAGDFEFRLQDPVAMLPADELFSDGKLVPLHLQLQLSSLKPSTSTAAESPSPETSSPPATAKPVEPLLFSPKAPRCSSRWRELLGLKKKQQQLCHQSSNSKTEPQKTTSSSSTKSLKHFLHHRSSKTTTSENASLSLPLLKDSDSESVSIESLSISSRLSLSSSSSSGHDHEDLPRLSVDSDKPAPNPNTNPISLHRNPNAHPRMRFVKARAGSFDNSHSPNPNPAGNRVGRSPIRRAESGAVESRGVSVDSPRMNSSGKIVFQSLERSSSSPSSFNGGPRFKHRGMERSYSANVRVTPVLNVPVCSLRGSSKTGSVFGLGQFFSSSSPQKKEGAAGANGATSRHRCNRN